MPPPVPTQAEIDQITIERDRQQNVADTFTAQGPALTARIAELQIIDGVFQSNFNYFNDEIIGRYDSERLALDGNFIAAPIIEQDIIDVSNLTGRLLPTPPSTDIIRIPEFDGLPLSVNPLNETQQLLDVETISSTFQNGYGSGTVTSALTTTILLPTSITLSITNTVAETLQLGDHLVVTDGVEVAIIEILTLVDGGGADPPFLSDLGILVIVPPNTSVGVGASFEVFGGFTDAERTTKISANPIFQPLMDGLVQDLEDALNARISSLNTQDTALTANQDDDGGVEIANALSVNAVALLFIQTFLIGTDVSDSGILNLSNEKTSRDVEILSRVGEIVSAYTSQTVNYYDTRFSLANDRGSVVRGTLRILDASQETLVVSAGFAATAADSVASLTAILP